MSVPMGGYGNSQPPQSLLDYYSSVEQGSNNRFNAGLAAQAKQAKAQLDNQYNIAKLQAKSAAESLEVDRWYKQQQVQLAQQQFGENVRQFDKQFGLNEADVTGWYGGKETLANLQQQFQQGVTQAGLTGMYNGQQTLAGQQQQFQQDLLNRQFGLDQSKFGLNVAQTAADLRSRPDMLFQYGEFARNLPGLLQGQGGQRYGGAPQGQTIGGQLQEVGMAGMQGPWNAQGGAGAAGGDQMMYAGGGGGFQENDTQRAQAEGGGGMVGITDPGFDPNAAAAKIAGGARMGGGSGFLSYGDWSKQQGGASGGGGDGMVGISDPGFNPNAAAGKVFAGGRGGGMSPEMGYLAAASPQSNDPTLAAIGKTYQQGFQKLGAQSLESMDKNDLGFLKSGGTFQGYDYDRELRKYAGSRLGQ